MLAGGEEFPESYDQVVDRLLAKYHAHALNTDFDFNYIKADGDAFLNAEAVRLPE